MGDDFDLFPDSKLFDLDFNGKLDSIEKSEYLNSMQAEEKTLGGFNLFANLKADRARSSSIVNSASTSKAAERNESREMQKIVYRKLFNFEKSTPKDLRDKYLLRTYAYIDFYSENAIVERLKANDLIELRAEYEDIMLVDSSGGELGYIQKYSAGRIQKHLAKGNSLYAVALGKDSIHIFIDIWEEYSVFQPQKFSLWQRFKNALNSVDAADQAQLHRREENGKESESGEEGKVNSLGAEGKTNTENETKAENEKFAEVECAELLADGALKLNEDYELEDQIAQLNTLLENSQQILTKTKAVNALNNILKKVLNLKKAELVMAEARQRALLAAKRAVENAKREKAEAEEASKTELKRRIAESLTKRKEELQRKTKKETADTLIIKDGSVTVQEDPNKSYIIPLSEKDLFVHRLYVAGTAYADCRAVGKVRQNSLLALCLEEDNPFDGFAVKFTDKAVYPAGAESALLPAFKGGRLALRISDRYKRRAVLRRGLAESRRYKKKQEIKTKKGIIGF